MYTAINSIRIEGGNNLVSFGKGAENGAQHTFTFAVQYGRINVTDHMRQIDLFTRCVV